MFDEPTDQYGENSQPIKKYLFMTQRKYEQTVSYLLDMQDGLSKGLDKYNHTVQKFEAERDYFLNKLKNNDMIKELQTACQLFNKVMYIETDTPDFIIVELSEEFDVVDIKEEYDIIDDSDLIENETETNEETKNVDERPCSPPIDLSKYVLKCSFPDELKCPPKPTSRLHSDTAKRILKNNTPTRDNILQNTIKGEIEYVVFKPTQDGLILNNRKFLNINNGPLPFTSEPINKYTDELFEIMKNHCTHGDTIKDIGMHPTIDVSTKHIIYSWA
jgi:hypothetical protein